MADDNKSGYASVTLGDMLARVDEHTIENADDNRSLTIRRVLKEYYNLKDKGVDILKRDADEIVKKVNK